MEGSLQDPATKTTPTEMSRCKITHINNHYQSLKPALAAYRSTNADNHTIERIFMDRLIVWLKIVIIIIRFINDYWL